MKNISKTIVRGKPKFLVTLTVAKGKRQKRYFDSQAEAKEFLSNYKAELEDKLVEMSELPPRIAKDVATALKLLPPNLTLTEVVQKYVAMGSVEISLADAFTKYKAHLEALNKPTKLRISSFFERFKEWNDATQSEVLDWLLTKGAPKTIKEYKAELTAFYNFCKRREYIKQSPFDYINTADLPAIKRDSPRIWSFDDLKLFFKFLKERRPQYITWFAIACFAGIRRAEINRMTPDMIHFDERRIVLPFSIVKTKDTWEMTDLPDNLWEWLEAYGTEIKPIVNSAFGRLTDAFEKWYEEYFAKEKNIVKTIKWEHNICRHSFCTYHLSLYRNPIKTSLLLKHRSPDTMWQHYLSGLVSQKVAEEYFKITPTSR